MADPAIPNISNNKTIQQNWAAAAADGTVTRAEAQQILDAAKASGGISMQELTASREISRDAVDGNGGRNLEQAQWLRAQIAGANAAQGSLRHIWETLKDLS